MNNGHIRKLFMTSTIMAAGLAVAGAAQAQTAPAAAAAAEQSGIADIVVTARKICNRCPWR
jgi:hypothetical protein